MIFEIHSSHPHAIPLGVCHTCWDYKHTGGFEVVVAWCILHENTHPGHGVELTMYHPKEKERKHE